MIENPLDIITPSDTFDVMSDENDFTRLVADATEKMKREAYARGWRDAIAALQKASEAVIEGAQGDGELPASISFGNVKEPGGQFNLTVGSTPYYTYQAIKKRPGMTGGEIVAAVQEAGHNVSEGSIRTSISRVKDKKLIVSRHNKWFPL